MANRTRVSSVAATVPAAAAARSATALSLTSVKFNWWTTSTTRTAVPDRAPPLAPPDPSRRSPGRRHRHDYNHHSVLLPGTAMLPRAVEQSGRELPALEHTVTVTRRPRPAPPASGHCPAGAPRSGSTGLDNTTNRRIRIRARFLALRPSPQSRTVGATSRPTLQNRHQRGADRYDYPVRG